MCRRRLSAASLHASRSSRPLAGCRCATFARRVQRASRMHRCQESGAAQNAPLSFKDFCQRALHSRTADGATLDVLERFLEVSGCPQLEERLGGLTDFTPELLMSPAGNISSLAAFAYAPKLRRIDLPYRTPISDLTPLANLTELRNLQLSASKVKDLTPLAGLKKLKVLDVRPRESRTSRPSWTSPT